MLGPKFGKYKENNKFYFTLPNFDHKRKYKAKKNLERTKLIHISTDLVLTPMGRYWMPTSSSSCVIPADPTT